MDKEEILQKSREENQNRDIYEQTVIKQAHTCAVYVTLALATVFFITQILVGKGVNYGLYAIVFSANMTVSWVEWSKLRKRHDLFLAVIGTLLVLFLSVRHLYGLLASAAAL